MADIDFTIEPRECRHTYGEHRCFLYNCPTDNPDHVHVCFADDFDWTEGDHTRLRRALIDEADFYIRSQVLTAQRRRAGLHAGVVQSESYRAVLKAMGVDVERR